MVNGHFLLNILVFSCFYCISRPTRQELLLNIDVLSITDNMASSSTQLPYNPPPANQYDFTSHPTGFIQMSKKNITLLQCKIMIGRGLKSPQVEWGGEGHCQLIYCERWLRSENYLAGWPFDWPLPFTDPKRINETIVKQSEQWIQTMSSSILSHCAPTTGHSKRFRENLSNIKIGFVLYFRKYYYLKDSS